MSKPSAAARMGTEPLNPLLLSLAIPMMISMLVQALYNVVDSIFVSYVNEAALSAVSLAFPIQNLLIAFAVGTAVGVNAHLSKSLGEGNREEAERAAMNGLLLAVCSALGFLLFGLFGAEAFITSQTSDPLIARYGTEYLTICTVFSIGCCLQCMMEKVLVASGHSTYAMITQMVGALTNIVLDPVFIFGLFGVPRMEAAGAAIATVIGQFAGAGTAFLLNAFSNHDVSLRLRGFRPSGRTIRRIYTVGLPSIGMNAIGSVMTFGMNAILIGFSSTAVAVFGVYFKLQSFVFMPVFGLNNGMVPIVSYNYGARKPDRITGTLRLATGYAVGIMVVGFLIAQLLPGVLLGIFNASADMLSIGTVALRIISFSFLLAGVNVISSSYFQALGHGVLALWVSIIRQLVVLLPVAWLLSFAGRLDLIWLAFPVAEMVAFALCLAFRARCRKNILEPLFAEKAAAAAQAQ